MINLTQIAEKLLNYLSNILLSKKPEFLSKRENLYTNFKIISILFLFSFSTGVLFSNFISYALAALLIQNESSAKEFGSSINNKNKSASSSSIKKAIIARNIFNHTGEIPYEDTPEGSESFLVKNFDKAPCILTEKLPVQLIGIIYTGDPETNLVSLKDPSVSLVDVYKQGQSIIGYESYSVHKITGPVNAEFRHDKKKICVSLNPPSYTTEGAPNAAQDAAFIPLDSSFVAGQLGPGFSKILGSARLVPQIIDGKTTGFKIFAIAKDSLFDKIKLVNGDVIKSVNGINLEDSSQGFKIYEAFQDENNIELQVQRNNELLIKKVTVQ